MRRTLTVLALAFVILFATPRPIAGWGAAGHRIIARIAWLLMNSDTRRDTVALLGSAEEFVSLSTWADAVRRDRPETSNWHFVNIPVGATSYDPARDCRPAAQGDCIIAALERARAGVADPALPLTERQEALKFLIHFVGDFHQPLHTIANNDRGGNDVRIGTVENIDLGGRQMNLHTVWDSFLIDDRGMKEEDYTEYLLRDLAARPVPPERVDFAAWAVATHALAENTAYTYPGFSAAGPPSSPVALDALYQRLAQPVIDRQLELAGARLARVLTEAFVSGRK